MYRRRSVASLAREPLALRLARRARPQSTPRARAVAFDDMIARRALTGAYRRALEGSFASLASRERVHIRTLAAESTPSTSESGDADGVRALLRAAKVDEKYADKFATLELALGAKTETLKKHGLGVKERKALLRASERVRQGLLVLPSS